MKRLLEETGLDQPTEFERMLLGSIVLDVAPEGSAATVLDRLDHAPVISLETRRKVRNQLLLALVAAMVAVVALLFARKHREKDVVPIAQEPPSAATMSSEEPAMQMPLPPAPTPSAVRSVAKPAPTVSAVRRPAPSVPTIPAPPAPALSTQLRNATRDAGSISQEFDKGQAASGLGRVDLTECKQFDGPDGAGHLVVVFATDGHAQSVSVDPPFAGTARGGCIAGKFAAVRVPPFQGSPVRVGKSFVIN